jgi:uncharacterized protein DUF1697
MPATHVALLRGINLGGRNKVAMADTTAAACLPGLWARVLQRLLALNACIWHNWMIGAPVKRSLIAYDH